MEVTKDQFNAYEGVRKSGVTNMFAVSLVSELSGLDKDTIIEIMNNYGRLSKKFKEAVE